MFHGYFSSQASELYAVSRDLQLNFIRSSSKIGGCYNFSIDSKYGNKRIDYVLLINEFCYFNPNPNCKYQVKLKNINGNVYELISCDSFDYISGRKHLIEERKQVIDSLKMKIFSLNSIVWTSKYDYYYVPYLIEMLNDSHDYFCLEEVWMFVDPGGPEYRLNCYPVNEFALRILKQYFIDLDYPEIISSKAWKKWYHKKIKNVH